MEINKNLIKNSIICGSLIAIARDLRSLYLDIKSSIFHVKNYYIISYRETAERRLHFGCGTDYKKGFINLDINKSADFYLDARNKLPFKDGAIQYIYSFHFIEHLKNDELIRHFKESFRILKSGGVYRICVPDFVNSIEAYIKRDNQWLETVKKEIVFNFDFISDDFISYGDYLDRVLHEYDSHKVFLDYEKIKNMLIYSGFQEMNINLSNYNPSIDLKKRKNFSIYIEAKK